MNFIDTTRDMIFRNVSEEFINERPDPRKLADALIAMSEGKEPSGSPNFMEGLSQIYQNIAALVGENTATAPAHTENSGKGFAAAEKRENTPLMEYIKRSPVIKLSVVKRFGSRRNEVRDSEGYTPFMSYLRYHGNNIDDEVFNFLKHSATVRGPLDHTALMIYVIGCRNPCASIVKRLAHSNTIMTSNRQTALMLYLNACKKPRMDIVSLLMHNLELVDGMGNSALLNYIKCNTTPDLVLINRLKPKKEIMDENGNTALMEYLIEGTSIEVEIVRALAHSPTIVDSDGDTPLMIYMMGHPNPKVEVVEILQHAPELKNYYGARAIDFYTCRNPKVNDAIVKIIG